MIANRCFGFPAFNEPEVSLTFLRVRRHPLFWGTLIQTTYVISIPIDADFNIIHHRPNLFVSAVDFQSFMLNAFWYFFIFPLQRPTYPVHYTLFGLIFLMLLCEGQFLRIFSIILSLSSS